MPTVNLGDNTTLTTIPTGGKLNITFQPDGSVINAAGNPVDMALFFYNAQADRDTATADLGAGRGRAGQSMEV